MTALTITTIGIAILAEWWLIARVLMWKRRAKAAQFIISSAFSDDVISANNWTLTTAYNNSTFLVTN